jgi:ankyrin repeat protein
MDELLDAAFNGDVAEVQWLVAEGVDVNVEDEDGWRPLHLAAFSGHVEVVTTLAELGAAVNAAAADGRKPLHLAAGNGHVEVTRTLVEWAERTLTHQLLMDGGRFTTRHWRAMWRQ